MKINELLYKTPEMTEEKLLEIIDNNIVIFRNKNLLQRVAGLHKEVPLNKALLVEYDLIQDKKSYLTKSQRDLVIGFVGLCTIQMVKGNGRESEQSTSQN